MNLLGKGFENVVADALAVLTIERVKGKPISLNKQFLMDAGIYIASDTIYQQVLKSWLFNNIYNRVLPSGFAAAGSQILELISIAAIKRLIENYLVQSRSMSFTAILMDVSELFATQAISDSYMNLIKK